jgi:hypothetical protein
LKASREERQISLSRIEKLTGLKLKIVKPRGIIIAGSTSQFAGSADKRDYFRMLNEWLKNVEVIPYDEGPFPAATKYCYQHRKTRSRLENHKAQVQE